MQSIFLSLYFNFNRLRKDSILILTDTFFLHLSQLKLAESTDKV